jgi:hypothetical protein
VRVCVRVCEHACVGVCAFLSASVHVDTCLHVRTSAFVLCISCEAVVEAAATSPAGLKGSEAREGNKRLHNASHTLPLSSSSTTTPRLHKVNPCG